RGDIVNVVSDNFVGSGMSFLVTLKEGKNFHSFIYNYEKELLSFPVATAAPFLVADPETLKQLVVICDGKDTRFYQIDKDSSDEPTIVEKEDFRLDVILHPEHTSSIIDLTGDLKPNLVLSTIEKGKRFLRIYDFYSEKPKLVQTMPLPDQMGPALFLNNNKSQTFDLIYVCVEDGKSHIKIHENLNTVDKSKLSNEIKALKYFQGVESGKVFEQKATREISIRSIFDTEAVLKDKNGMPTGLFLADVEGTDNTDILITLKDGSGAYVQSVILKDDEFIQPKYNKHMKEHKDVLSVSVFGFNLYDNQDLLINHIENGTPVLKVLNTKSLSNKARLKVITLHSHLKGDRPKKGDLNLHIVFGATYFVSQTDHNGKTFYFKVAQSTHTSYPSMQSLRIYITLEEEKRPLEYIIVHTNYYYIESVSKIKPYFYRRDITPTILLVFSIFEKEWHMKEIVSINYSYTVILFFCALFLFNLFLLIFCTFSAMQYERARKGEYAYFYPVLTTI
ncbi:MAG: hypothetical protein QRY16_21860, partial [Enterobacterales bacterium endosymbiont of Blomia tropicalis]|uniref:hypothetical protein n=1 Tax=Mixta mediterraneensis TaxID=2758443 RepID=UPI0025A8D7F4